MSASQLARRLAVVFVAAIFLFGCTHHYEPVYNVNNNPTAPGLSAEQVAQAITTAASKQTIQKWELTPTKPGAMRGKVSRGGYSADADILYTGKAYSIVFVSQVNLAGKDGTIHRNYNRAVKSLEEEINRQLLAAAN
jgi:hypothetical protein